jgi:group I intron endonuclease
MKICGIYTITHIASKRVYVGSAVDVVNRWRNHRWLLRNNKHHNVRLQRAWLKCGEQAFHFAVIEPIADKAELLAREQHWMDKLRAITPRAGYNTSPVAGSMLGHKHSLATRAEMSRTRKGRKAPRYEGFVTTAEHRAKIGAAHRGRVRPPEWNAAVSAGLKGRIQSPETRAKISAAAKGNKRTLGQVRSAEARANMSAAQKRLDKKTMLGRKHSPESLAKMRAAKIGKTHTNEARAKMKASHAVRLAMLRQAGPQLPLPLHFPHS